MGILNKIFGADDSGKNEKQNSNSATPWIDLNSISQLDEIERISDERTVAILKHSTRCGISRMVLKMFESDYKIDETKPVSLYFLDLIAHREISNEIAERFKVRHESPQLIVLKNREVVHHASHQGISADKLAEFVD